jgi:hypothetical protein
MKRLIRFTTTQCGLLSLFLSISNAWALTPDQVIALKNAGVSDQTIQLMIRQEQDAAVGTPADFPGRKEIKDKDGKTVIIYSTGRSTRNNREAKEEKQTEKAWEMLNNIIVDPRKFR